MSEITPQEQFDNDHSTQNILTSIHSRVREKKYAKMLSLPQVQAVVNNNGISKQLITVKATTECFPILPKGAKYMYFRERKRVIVIVFCQTSKVTVVQFGAAIFYKEDWATKGYITKAEAKAIYKTHRLTVLQRFKNHYVTVTCPSSVIHQNNSKYATKDSFIEHELRSFLRKKIMNTGCKWIRGIHEQWIVEFRNDWTGYTWNNFDHDKHVSYRDSDTSWRFTHIFDKDLFVIIKNANSLREAMSCFVIHQGCLR